MKCVGVLIWKPEDKKPLGRHNLDGIIIMKWMLNIKEELGLVCCFSE
jgi:hypothetical protein